MKPRFALSLSFEGIRLLHRAAGGWRMVGDVALDSSDLSGALGDLLAKAERLEPGNVHTKLLLPSEQIKFLTIDTTDMDEAARRAASEAALDGATPYAVADLAFDICVEGEKTHIAAVARETLAEAEGFATEHGFRPVSFAAIPGDQAYLGEPFFGLTAAAANLLAAGETVEPDGIAVVSIGDAVVPEEATPASELTQEEPAPEPEIEIEPAPELEPVAAPEVPEPVLSEPPRTEPVNARSIIDPEPPLAAPSLPVADESLPGDPPLIGFASRRRAEKREPPRLSGANRSSLPPVPSVTSGKIPPAPQMVAPPPPIPEPVQAVEPTAHIGTVNRSPVEEPVTIHADDERDRMTVFGARESQIGGKPRFLGLLLTTALLVFLAGVAAWASVFLEDRFSFSSLFGTRSPEIASIPEPTTAAPEITTPTEDPTFETASLAPALTAEDSAVLDALSEPAPAEPRRAPTEAELDAKYATDGIWARAPGVPPAPAGLVSIDDLYLTSIDPVSTKTDAVALPPVATFQTDLALDTVASPAAAGTRFALDDRGLVIPTLQGALSPDGFTVFQGRPPLVPPGTPDRLETAPQDPELRTALAAFRPKTRPGDLAETTERAQLDGLTRSELAGFRPALRPQSLQEQAAALAAADIAPVDTDAAVTEALTPEDPSATATRLAAAASLRPDVRPRNFARTVQRAERAKPQEETRVASAATIAPRAVTPKIPSKASVAKAATTRNAINLRDVNLIGVYGKPSNRRALIRLSNGRYKKVVVGDRVDGGVVSAIGEGELRYTKRGRNLVLKMPR